MDNQQGSLILTEIPSFGGYHVSGDGELFSTRRYAIPRMLTLHQHKARGQKRYWRVMADGKLHLAHRIIACIHVGRRLRKYEVVNHIDGNTLNNSPSNLEVVSHKQNVAHAVKMGLYCSGKEWFAARASRTFKD